MSDYTGPLAKPAKPGQHKAMYDALEGRERTDPFCECEYTGCTQHPEPAPMLPADLLPIHTIYGVFKICIACRESHPIPTQFLKDA